jgi:uncharacterized repeat protein (TIGR03803 family)
VSVSRWLSVCVASILLAACGKSPLPPSGPSSNLFAAGAQPGDASGFKIIYSFNLSPDGNYPHVGLIVDKGVLYGTTAAGGIDFGTVFKITTSGAERVLYSFKGYPYDGDVPGYGVTAVANHYYGVTYVGGDGSCAAPGSPSPIVTGCGIIFKVSGSGHEDVLYNFKPGKDGAEPNGGLTLLNGTLYGTTSHGGGGSCPVSSSVQGCGVVFSVSLSGKERVLYRFQGGNDGAYPLGNLVVYDGALYGATGSGGLSKCSGGCGTIFRISGHGSEKVIYRFKGGSDGVSPLGGMTVLHGVLYGTAFGGARGKGIVFGLTTAGNERLLYTFKGGEDGAFPNQGLINVNGALYGMTAAGGRGSGCFGRRTGCGTIFRVTLSGDESVLHRFTGGGSPYGGLIDFDGTLYGTTSTGGKHALGTVFKISP